MGPEYWFNLAKEGGLYIAPFLLAALVWMNGERKRLLDECREKDEKLYMLAVQTATLTAELKAIVFGKSA